MTMGIPLAPPISDADLQAALAEITSKTPEQIEGATAVKWGARALAAWAITKGQPVGSPAYLFWYGQTVAYRHESLEHAAWGPIGLLDAIRAQLTGLP